ncbi:hypothetical protein L596_015276 [Steinernema carpocapsae]|uniref:Uncharacterized protein n=1 Tax=Steinernema carpocapsae TaxID=34508 RepID=A0A4U5NFE4_STECR|nr:hypothetical protein L596_015276 [Steinernema carpocapsae]
MSVAVQTLRNLLRLHFRQFPAQAPPQQTATVCFLAALKRTAAALARPLLSSSDSPRTGAATRAGSSPSNKSDFLRIVDM